MNAIDTFIEALKKADYVGIFESGSPMFHELMLNATTLFEHYPHGDQALALACMFGILIGTVEGETVEAENGLGVIITLEDRIRIFVAQARIVARATIADKVMGDRPVQGGKPS